MEVDAREVVESQFGRVRAYLVELLLSNPTPNAQGIYSHTVDVNPNAIVIFSTGASVASDPSGVVHSAAETVAIRDSSQNVWDPFLQVSSMSLVIRGEDPEDHGDRRFPRHGPEAEGGFTADVVEVWSLPANHAAERHDTVETARSGGPARGLRQLPGAGHSEHLGLRRTVLTKGLLRAGEQTVRDVGIEARHDHGDSHPGRIQGSLRLMDG